MIKFLKLFLSTMMVWALATPARADLILNGGFESGFTNWTRADQTGSDGTFALQSGPLSPINALTVPPPPGGIYAAMTDSQGPGSHVLYQNFTVLSPLSTAFLNFDLFIGNRAGEFATPNNLDFSTPAVNQQARVDIMLASADPFSVAPTDVLLNVYQTHVGDPLVSGYSTQSLNIAALLNAHLNQPLRLRFAEVDNELFFNLGVDNVHILDTTGGAVPEPSTWVLGLGGLAAMVWLQRRRANRLGA